MIQHWRNENVDLNSKINSGANDMLDIEASPTNLKISARSVVEMKNLIAMQLEIVNSGTQMS